MALEVEVAVPRHKNALSFCDNTAAVSWVTRMASKSSRIGGRLVKGLAVLARQRRMCLLGALSVSGEANKMADIASCSFCLDSGLVLSNPALLAHFNAHFPLPQNRSWKIVTSPPEAISKVFSTLRGEQLTMAQWMNPVAEATGNIGRDSSTVPLLIAPHAEWRRLWR